MHNYTFQDFAKSKDKIIVNRSVYIDNNLPMHGHNNFMEIVYINKGSGLHYLNDGEFSVHAGDLILLDFKSVHTFRPKTSDFEWINVLFEPEFITDRLINEMSEQNMIKLSFFNSLMESKDEEYHDIVLNALDEAFALLVRLMLKEYEDAARDSNYILKNYLIILLAKVYSLCQREKEASPEVNILVKQIMDEVSANIQEEVTLSYIANKVHLAPKYLSRFFKQQTGKTFIEYVHERRIAEACRLLEQTDMAINDIMLCCGMKSPKFFYELFKKKIGITPGEYRKVK